MENWRINIFSIIFQFNIELETEIYDTIHTHTNKTYTYIQFRNYRLNYLNNSLAHTIIISNMFSRRFILSLALVAVAACSVTAEVTGVDYEVDTNEEDRDVSC